MTPSVVSEIAALRFRGDAVMGTRRVRSALAAFSGPVLRRIDATKISAKRASTRAYRIRDRCASYVASRTNDASRKEWRLPLYANR